MFPARFPWEELSFILENNEDMINEHISYFSVSLMSFVYPYLRVLANNAYANLILPKNGYQLILFLYE